MKVLNHIQSDQNRKLLDFYFLVVAFLFLIIGMWSSPAVGEELIVATTGGVIEFQVLEGDRKWAWVERQRILSAQWLLSPDGTFLYKKSDVPHEVFPIAGVFHISDEALLFKGTKTSSQGWSTSVHGRIMFKDGHLVLHLVESSKVEGSAETLSVSPSRHMTWSAVILLQAITIPSDKPQIPGGLSSLRWDINEHRAG